MGVSSFVGQVGRARQHRRLADAGDYGRYVVNSDLNRTLLWGGKSTDQTERHSAEYSETAWTPDILTKPLNLE